MTLTVRVEAPHNITQLHIESCLGWGLNAQQCVLDEAITNEEAYKVQLT